MRPGKIVCLCWTALSTRHLERAPRKGTSLLALPLLYLASMSQLAGFPAPISELWRHRSDRRVAVWLLWPLKRVVIWLAWITVLGSF
jgi:hypothetical protein